MTVRFNADEIFEMAEQIEKNGADFYRAAAEKFKGSTAAKTLLDLARMEETHRIIFTEMRAALAGKEKEASFYDPEDQVKLYLRAIADGQVFDVKSGPAKYLTGKEGIQEILRIAIGLEKDSIIFYLGMRETVPEKLGREKIDNIISEEKSHIVLLADKLSSLPNR